MLNGADPGPLDAHQLRNPGLGQVLEAHEEATTGSIACRDLLDREDDR